MFHRDIVECLASKHPSVEAANESASDLSSEVTDRSTGNSAGALKSLFERIRSRLDVLVDVVSRSLKQYHRLSVNALLTIYVHCRDVIQMLITRNVTDIGDFQWSRCGVICVFIN